MTAVQTKDQLDRTTQSLRLSKNLSAEDLEYLYSGRKVNVHEVEQFVMNWYKGFDAHQPVEFFTSKLDAKFLIQFPEREAITTEDQFKRWFNEVNPLTEVKHEIRAIEVLQASNNTAKIKIRVDWSARNASETLFFPALQNWEMVKFNGSWKIRTYQVVKSE